MKFRPGNYKENLTKLIELSYKLNSMITDGSFYELSFLDRYREVRKVKHLYNKLRGPVSDAHLQQAVSFAAVLMLITGARCSDTSNAGFASVTIDLGLKKRSSIEQIAEKGQAPSKVTAISLTVSGPGMEPIIETVPLDTGIIQLEVPAGDSRLFSVRADLPTEAYLSGSTEESLEAGASVNVPITMKLMGPPTFADGVTNPFGLTNGTECVDGVGVLNPKPFCNNGNQAQSCSSGTGAGS